MGTFLSRCVHNPGSANITRPDVLRFGGGVSFDPNPNPNPLEGGMSPWGLESFKADPFCHQNFQLLASPAAVPPSPAAMEVNQLG